MCVWYKSTPECTLNLLENMNISKRVLVNLKKKKQTRKLFKYVYTRCDQKTVLKMKLIFFFLIQKLAFNFKSHDV